MTIQKIITETGAEIRKPRGDQDLRAYINWNGRWCHVFIKSGFDQLTLLGAPVKMLEFKLTKNAKISYTAEKTKFYKQKPSPRQKRSEGA